MNNDERAQIIAKATGYMIVQTANGKLPFSTKDLGNLTAGNRNMAFRLGMTAEDFERLMSAASTESISSFRFPPQDNSAHMDRTIRQAIEIIEEIQQSAAS